MNFLNRIDVTTVLHTDSLPYLAVLGWRQRQVMVQNFAGRFLHFGQRHSDNQTS